MMGREEECRGESVKSGDRAVCETAKRSMAVHVGGAAPAPDTGTVRATDNASVADGIGREWA
jgi:hypothetical protein